MRALRVLVVIAVILGGLFVAADRVAVHLAESEAAERIGRTEGVAGTPSVSIHGFPFLTQVAAQEIDEVDLRLDGFSAGTGDRTVRITELNAELRDVRLENNFSSATAGRASGSALIGYDDISRAAEEGVKVGYGGTDEAGRGQVKVTARASVLGREIERSVESTITVTGGDTIRLRARSVPGSEIPGLEDLIRDRIDFERKIEGLPEGIEVEQVRPTQDGVRISVTGRDLPLRG